MAEPEYYSWDYPGQRYKLVWISEDSSDYEAYKKYTKERKTGLSPKKEIHPVVVVYYNVHGNIYEKKWAEHNDIVAWEKFVVLERIANRLPKAENE